MRESGRYCPTCQRQTLHHKEQPNHLLHFVVTVATGGAWLIPWLFIATAWRPWRCASCGTPEPAPFVVKAGRFAFRVLLVVVITAFCLVALGEFLTKRAEQRQVAKPSQSTRPAH